MARNVEVEVSLAADAGPPGLEVVEWSDALGFRVDLLEVTKPLVRDLISEGELRAEGVKRGTKYFPPDD